MPIEVELDGQPYRKIGDKWYDGTSFILVPRAIAHRLDHKLTAKRAANAQDHPMPRARRSRRKRKKNKIEREQAFPIVASVIRNNYEEGRGYVTHGEIVASLLEHPKFAPMARLAAQGQSRTAKGVAGHLVGWWSRSITTGRSGYEDQFERKRVGGAWAYRPTS
jgi:hypothetical protein